MLWDASYKSSSTACTSMVYDGMATGQQQTVWDAEVLPLIAADSLQGIWVLFSSMSSSCHGLPISYGLYEAHKTGNSSREAIKVTYLPQ